MIEGVTVQDRCRGEFRPDQDLLSADKATVNVGGSRSIAVLRCQNAGWNASISAPAPSSRLSGAIEAGASDLSI
jgi:hypothetical protein